MSEQPTPEALEARIMDLEVKASYTDDLLEQLNMTIYRQQQQIDALINEVRQLRQQVPEAGQGAPRNLRDELPPHY
ncbi:SlyX family protein [Comamonas aquatica]|uniref:SlyX family protein n=1 Tax=Comamonas aquatica TaxID=225991 RepID=UPI00244D4377|nr:SlyX family protein [Comamonas aquatica]MDH0380486.1 SlyX family protein [Comamonas aquatica]MDH0429025.1 SlyX family protein [Comamonas aquatica]MDH0941318.1 SlyX family protein [Comamonas aquatica]